MLDPCNIIDRSVNSGQRCAIRWCTNALVSVKDPPDRISSEDSIIASAAVGASRLDGEVARLRTDAGQFLAGMRRG
jgi:hypothetical protein